MRKKYLNIGSGVKKKESTQEIQWINCDREKSVNPDKIVDLEEKMDFKTNSIDEVVGNHVLQCIHNFISLMHELRRICKNGALLKFKVPFYSSVGSYSDPLHTRFFTPFTFDYFTKCDELLYETKSKKNMFKIRKVKLHFGIGSAQKFNLLIDPLLNLNHRLYCRVFAGICPAAEIEFEIEVMK